MSRAVRGGGAEREKERVHDIAFDAPRAGAEFLIATENTPAAGGAGAPRVSKSLGVEMRPHECGGRRMICNGITYTAGMMVLALAATASPVRGDAAGPPMLRLDEPTGACCALGGVCWDDSTATACWTSHAGIWQGPGSLCETTDCYGACCAAGACYECDQALCLTLYSGVWQGGGASCDPNPCSPPTGACCLAGGACEELPESVCETAGGAFMGLTIPCEPSPCTTDYCTAGSAVCEEHIARVPVGRLDNRSGCERYADYTHRLTDVVAGEQYLITVTNGLPFEGDVCSIWIDWNNDHIFEDVAPEWIGDVVGGGASPPYRLSFTVPAEVLLGPKRVRIRIDYNNRDPDPCGIRAYGEVEDYTLKVMPFPGACCLPCGYCRRLPEPECIAAGALFGRRMRRVNPRPPRSRKR